MNLSVMNLCADEAERAVDAASGSERSEGNSKLSWTAWKRKAGTCHTEGKYIKGEAKQLRGMFQANARGFGFVTVEGESEDIFISEDDMNGAMQGDEVEVVITKAPEGKRREGKINEDRTEGNPADRRLLSEPEEFRIRCAG